MESESRDGALSLACLHSQSVSQQLPTPNFLNINAAHHKQGGLACLWALLNLSMNSFSVSFNTVSAVLIYDKFMWGTLKCNWNKQSIFPSTFYLLECSCIGSVNTSAHLLYALLMLSGFYVSDCVCHGYWHVRYRDVLCRANSSVWWWKKSWSLI